MTVIPTTGTAGTPAASAPQKSSLNGMGQGDFLRLMVEQLKQQDPFDPVDNKEMLAQMAQFSGLAGTTETNAALASIAQRLDTLIALQQQQTVPAPADPAG